VADGAQSMVSFFGITALQYECFKSSRTSTCRLKAHQEQIIEILSEFGARLMKDGGGFKATKGLTQPVRSIVCIMQKKISFMCT